MKIENLIQIVQNLLDVNAVDFEFKVYDSLKMDNVQLDVNKVNGLARITTGSIDPILNLGQSSATMVVEFIYPYERLEAVRQTLLNVSQNSAGLVVPNNTLDASLTGSTGVIISYPTQGNYFNGTMGETARSRLICYFDINEKSVLSNDIKLSIVKDYYEANTELKGAYYKYSGGVYVPVTLPDDYESNTIYYEPLQDIPEEYERLDYIELTGTQYVNLGFTPTNRFRIQTKLTPKVVDGASGQFPCNWLYFEPIGDGTTGTINYKSSGSSYAVTTYTANQEYEIDYLIDTSINGYYLLNVNGVSYGGDFPNESFESIYLGIDPVMLSSYTYVAWRGLIKDTKVYGDQEILMKDLKTCRRRSDNVVGFYDLVSQQFIPASSTNQFIGGTQTMAEANLSLRTDGSHLFFKKDGDNYISVKLPAQYTANTIYYLPEWENIPYYKYIITRHRLSTTNKYNNNKEMQTVNDGQSIDFSLAVPSIKGSVINSIKDDMLTGDNIGKVFTFRLVEENGNTDSKFFENMIASGDFSYEIVPGNVLLFKILFVYKRM